MARKHLNMTRDEFLYDHDAVAISTMLATLFQDQMEQKNEDEGNLGEQLGVNVL